MATGRSGDLVWMHMSDFIPPNIHQFTTLTEGANEVRFTPSDRTHWAVPVDDDNTMFMGYLRMREGSRTMGDPAFGQTGNRPYQERQRVPGDYDAQVSQRPIAIHGLEHLGWTDRGIIMLRNIVRRGIRAVQKGEDSPGGLFQNHGEVIATYSNDTVLRLAPASTPKADRQLLRETGLNMAEKYFKTPPVQQYVQQGKVK